MEKELKAHHIMISIIESQLNILRDMGELSSGQIRYREDMLLHHKQKIKELLAHKELNEICRKAGMLPLTRSQEFECILQKEGNGYEPVIADIEYLLSNYSYKQALEILKEVKRGVKKGDIWN